MRKFHVQLIFQAVTETIHLNVLQTGAIYTV